MIARVDIEWDGRRWRFDDVPVQVDQASASLLDGASYQPRRFRLALPMGDTYALRVAGHHPDSMRVLVTAGGRPVSTAPVVSMEPAIGTAATLLQCAEVPEPEASTMPPSVDMTLRPVNRRRTERANAQIDEANAMALDFYYGAPGGGLDDVEAWRRFHEYGGWVDRKAGTFDAADYTTVYGKRVEGRLLPLVFGRPGSNGTPATEAIPYDSVNKRMLVAGHAGTPGSVRLYDADDVENPDTGWTATHQTLDDGRVVLAITEPGVPTKAYDEDKTWFIAWNGTAEGLPGDAFSVLEYLTGHSRGIRLDVASLEAVRHLLRGYELARVVDAETDAWSLLSSEVLPLLPVAMVSTPDGVGFVDARPYPADREPRCHITAGADFAPLPPDHRGGGDVVNSWTLQYGPHKQNRTYDAEYTADWRTFHAARVSLSRHGARERVLKTGWVYDPSVAHRIGGDLVERHARDWLPITYQARPALYGVEGRTPLERGTVIRLTDTSRSISARDVVIVDTARSGDDLRVTVAVG